MTTDLLPSAEQAVVAWAKAHVALGAIHGGRVGTRLNSVLPAIRITRVGGSPPEWWRDEPSIQLECWAADQGAADLLARTLIAALPDFRHFAIPGGRVYSYTVTSGPFWSPDDPQYSTNARYILTISILTTP